ncbi:MAG: hypothetical protein OCD02_12680 [Spirochaetaceae bacterium]
MDILSIVIIMFLVLETLNVFMLYFTPGTSKGNGLGVFNAYEKSKENPEVHALVKYLINWVAGTKLIFIVLLIFVLISGNDTMRMHSVIALIITISTFYWRLYPIMRKLDNEGQITPKGYSKTLRNMISVFLVVFIIALVVFFVIKTLG